MKKFISTLPALLFFIGIIFFAYSPLTMPEMINAQNEVFILFLQQLKKDDLMSALLLVLSYLWANILCILLIFLVLIGFGFLIYVYFFRELDFKVVVVSHIALIIVVLILTNFSVVMSSIALSLFLGILWLHKTFEPRKNNFSTGYSVIASRLGLLNIFLAIGILLTVSLNIQDYEEQVSESNKELIMSFIPEMSDIKEAQKEQISQITEGFQYALTERYDAMTEESKAQCKPMYEALVQGLESYKERSFQKIEEEEMMVGEEELMQLFPFYNLTVKITPLLVAITAYALLAVLIPPVGIFCGIVYVLMKKIKPKKKL
jgi:cbb3-type cytochrome oxidase subunit 3